MFKSKVLMILLVFALLFANFSVCLGDDSTATSIYNSTGYTPIYNPIDDDPDAVSIYNSTGYIPIPTDPDEIVELAELIEYVKVPIDVAYSREILQNINVSDDILEAFSRFGLWLETQNVDTNTEDINIMYIDDDLRVIENYWIFATRPEAKEMYIEMIQNSKSENPSPAEMIDFLHNFGERYPVKYVRTGLALFITVENKDFLLSDISEEDIQMLESMKNALLEETYMNLNWGSSNPNVHADMSRWAAEKAGFSSGDVNIISNFAAEPDNVSFIDCIDIPLVHMGILYNIGSLGLFAYVGGSVIGGVIEYFYLKNYNHYYNPMSTFGIGFGGAPACIENEYNSISTSGSKNEKLEHLSYSSHYMADLSMPLHVNYASEQAYPPTLLKGFLFEQPHFSYENNYVGANWTTGHNFSRFAQDTNLGYFIHNPGLQSETLAYYAYFASDEAWACGVGLTNSLIPPYYPPYSPSSTLFYMTAFNIDLGQMHLIGLMQSGYQQIFQDFTNQQDITFQLEKAGYRVYEADLTNLRVSMGAGDSASIYLNNNEILKFVDSSAGGNLYIYNESGNLLGVIYQVNGKQNYENMTFDVFFGHDGSVMNIVILKYSSGSLNSIYTYSYMTNNDMSTLRANMIGYQSNVDFISGRYEVYHELMGTSLHGLFTD